MPLAGMALWLHADSGSSLGRGLHPAGRQAFKQSYCIVHATVAAAQRPSYRVVTRARGLPWAKAYHHSSITISIATVIDVAVAIISVRSIIITSIIDANSLMLIHALYKDITKTCLDIGPAGSAQKPVLPLRFYPLSAL